jgi:phosphate transport system substrate-binding protein
MKRKGLALLAVTAVALFTTVSAGAKSQATVLNGAGSTFVQPLVSTWTPALGSAFDYTIQYSGVGSGAGITAISNRTVDFGASDAPLTAAQFTTCNGCVQIPWALGATAMAYNIPGAPVHMHLSADVIAGIYLGKITNWDDPAIAALNKGATLPNLAITPAWRTGNSGTTYNITDFLQSASKVWQASGLGTGQSVAFPVGTGASGSSGVAGVVENTPGAICYVDVAYALANHLHFAAIENQAGKYIFPSLVDMKAAAAAFPTVGTNNEMHIVNPPKSAPAAYPICTYTYIILPLSSNNATALRKMVFWALTTGQSGKYTAKLLFDPIPKAVLVAAEKTLDQIKPAS